MGCDWYTIHVICSSSYAIAVTNKDIKESHKPGSSSQNDEHNEERIDESLTPEVVKWLLDQANGFKLYEIEGSVVLFMRENNKIDTLVHYDAPGPYEIGREWRSIDCGIDPLPEGVEYNELLEIARKLTPQENKLSFPPGRYSFSTIYSMMRLKELKATKEDSKEPAKDKDATAELQECKPANETNIPPDFELVVGKGDKCKTISTCKVILSCYFPEFDALVADNVGANKLELPDLDPTAMQLVLDAYTTRKKIQMPSTSVQDRERFSAVQLVLEKFGLGKKPAAKKAKTEHPALSDPRWLDTTFVVGPNQEEIKANRVVLASMNPVLCRILFGTGVLTVDPSKPIQWPDFDATAVRQVLQALVHRGKDKFVVPLESVESAKALVDYLMETRGALKLQYETPFKRNFQWGFSLSPTEDCEGYVLKP